jgi:fructan beta-fructosidase
MNSPLPIFVLALFGLITSARADRPDILVADFEGPDYGDWTVTGSAFGAGPARGALPGQMPVEGFAGKGLVNSFHGGDGSTGTLTSSVFTLARPFLSFLIGGGGHAGKTVVHLLIDENVVRSATGPNTAPGGSEALSEESFDVAEFAGKPARIQIVDDAKGGWGHINADQFVLTDKASALANATREIVCDKQFLNLPVKTGAKKRRMKLSVDGAVVREFEIELADAEPDFWVFLDLTPFREKRAVVSVDRLPAKSASLGALEVSDSIRGAENLYRESLRPQFHFSSRRGWLNDPNGLVFHEGEYHLYYQHNPYGWGWGNMHWGHAVSPDLVHWKELPIAIYPQRFNDWAFSGSAVVDRENTSGWKRGDADVLVAAYTSTGRGECIVWSRDRGRTWTEYEGNPVVKHDGRDPRLLWHEPTRQWVMALYDEAEKKRWITFHTSPDLKTWTYQSRIEGFYECPDFFELPVDGDAKNTRWVLTGASSEYMIGRFDGREFRPETPMLPGHRGENFYAAQTFSNEPRGRVVQIGWGRFDTPGMPFNQMMCFPAELSLRTVAEGLRLCWQPVAEIEKLRAKSQRFEPRTLSPGENALGGIDADLLEIRAEFEPGTATEVAFDVQGVRVAYDTAKQELVAKRFRVPLPPIGGKVRLIILADRTSLEVFGNEGAAYVPLGVPLRDAKKPLSLSTAGGTAKITALEVHELRSAWENKNSR